MKKLLIVLFACLLFACSDFLEPKSQSEYIPREAAALNEMLLGNAYIQAAGGDEVMNLLLMFDDDIMCSDSLGAINTMVMTGDNFQLLEKLYAWQPDIFIQEGSLMYRTPWEWFYSYILGANAALDYIDGVSGTDDERNIVKAQALALRGFYYFQLVNMWGAPYNHDKKALGVPLKVTSALEAKELPRNTVEEVYAQILADLDEAEKTYEKLPREQQYRKDYRTSLPMVQLLKSRVYLYMEDWKNAAIYAQKVIDDWDFMLTDLNSLPQKTTTQPYYNFISQDCSEVIWVFGKIANFVNLVKQQMMFPDPYKPGQSLETNFFNASSELLEAFKTGDLRKENYIVRSPYTDSKNNQHLGGYAPYGKFAVNYAHEPISNTNFAHAFRLAEAYLNLAEAAALDEDEKTAKWALEALLEKRFVPGTVSVTETGSALVDRVRLERRLELCFEGHRWFDLRRYGMPSITHEWKSDGKVIKRYTLKEKDLFYTWPIPQEVMEENRKLVQNPLPEVRN